MYDIQQFLPTLYVVVALGISAFCVAAQLPGVWVVAVGAIAFNAWLKLTGRFRALPRIVANIGILIVLLIMAATFRDSSKILLVGEFLVLLQVVKFYEPPSNRDHAQLLVLSLLLMVAASISTASLVFGMMMVLYLFCALYCCLLFHLKVETDHAKRAFAVPPEQINPSTLRQDQRYLASSMRRLTAMVAMFSIIAAVATFLFFPRGPGEGVLAPMRWKPSETLTGFSDSVNFQNVAKITQNTQVVAWVSLTKENGEPAEREFPLYLRGVTLDTYSGDGSQANGVAYQWTRRPTDSEDFEARGDSHQSLERPIAGEQITQSIHLNPTGTNALFAIGAPNDILPDEPIRVRHFPRDATMQSAEPLLQQVAYTVTSNRQVRYRGPNLNLSFRDFANSSFAKSQIDPKIEAFARKADVSGSDASGPLAARRKQGVFVDELDVPIASNIEQYLHKNYFYTLDLTDAKRIDQQDPMVAFLYDLKRGHCEYFAGAMTLMCQSMGMQARVVVGFKCDEYNPMAHFYTVRQSHAHAWVEVLGRDNIWHTFDPTSGREAPTEKNPSVFDRIASMYNYMEYTWATTVVAYDRDSRNSVMVSVDRSISSSASSGRQWFSTIKDWLDRNTYSLSSGLIGAMIGAMVLAIVGLVGWFAIERMRLRRRARRIGLDALPSTLQFRLARQLGFFDDLLRLLEKHRITRKANLTPREFGESLTFLPVDAFDAVQSLTEIFYRVRYGKTVLTPSQRRHLNSVLATVEGALGRR